MFQFISTGTAFVFHSSFSMQDAQEQNMVYFEPYDHHVNMLLLGEMGANCLKPSLNDDYDDLGALTDFWFVQGWAKVPYFFDSVTTSTTKPILSPWVMAMEHNNCEHCLTAYSSYHRRLRFCNENHVCSWPTCKASGAIRVLEFCFCILFLSYTGPHSFGALILSRFTMRAPSHQ